MPFIKELVRGGNSITAQGLWIPGPKFATGLSELNYSDDYGHLCLVPDFIRNVFSISLLRKMLDIGYNMNPLNHFLKEPF